MNLILAFFTIFISALYSMILYFEFFRSPQEPLSGSFEKDAERQDRKTVADSREFEQPESAC